MKHILLKDLLLEQHLELKKFYETVATNCKVSVNGYLKGRRLYRGTRQQQTYTKYDPTNYFRTSKDSNNLSLLYPDSMESWKSAGIPPRSRSVIFSAGKDIAGGYGTEMCVFIEGNPMVGYGQRYDNYDNYMGGLKKAGLDHFIRSSETLDGKISKLLRVVSDTFKLGYDDRFLYKVSNVDDLVALLKKYENIISTNSLDDVYTTISEGYDSEMMVKLLKQVREYGLTGLLDIVYDTNTNEIIAIPLDEFLEIQTAAEAWCSAPYYMVGASEVSSRHLEPEKFPLTNEP